MVQLLCLFNETKWESESFYVQIEFTLVSKGARQKKNVENSTLGLTPLWGPL